jgi:hypothetical protein
MMQYMRWNSGHSMRAQMQVRLVALEPRPQCCCSKLHACPALHAGVGLRCLLACFACWAMSTFKMLAVFCTACSTNKRMLIS